MGWVDTDSLLLISVRTGDRGGDGELESAPIEAGYLAWCCRSWFASAAAPGNDSLELC